MIHKPNFLFFLNHASEFGLPRVLGHPPSTMGMRDAVTFRVVLRPLVQRRWIIEVSSAEKPISPAGGSQPAPNAQEQLLTLSKVLAAIVTGNQSKLASLTEEMEPGDELRKLIRDCGAGQPLRESEPCESALRDARTAAKAGRFLNF